jgi:hypothetical protein
MLPDAKLWYPDMVLHEAPPIRSHRFLDLLTHQQMAISMAG